MDEFNTFRESFTTSAQSTTVQDSSPSESFANEIAIQKFGAFAVPCIIGFLYVAFIIFLVVLFYRLVRATERIAAKLESGITVNKENKDTIN